MNTARDGLGARLFLSDHVVATGSFEWVNDEMHDRRRDGVLHAEWISPAHRGGFDPGADYVVEVGERTRTPASFDRNRATVVSHDDGQITMVVRLG